MNGASQMEVEKSCSKADFGERGDAVWPVRQRRRLSVRLADRPFFSNHPVSVVWNGFFARGYALEPGSDAEAALADAHRRATSGPLESLVSLSYLDARVFAIYADMPCLVYGPLTENIHGYDERVSLSSLKRVTAAIALFIADWCGLEPMSERADAIGEAARQVARCQIA